MLLILELVLTKQFHDAANLTTNKDLKSTHTLSIFNVAK